MRRLLSTLAFFGALVATHASAAPLTLNYSGVLGTLSTLNGVAFSAPTSFSFEATFDSTTDTQSLEGVGFFDAVVTFHIAGMTYTSDPAGDVNVFLVDYPNHKEAGLVSSSPIGLFGGIFHVATPAFDGDAPVPTVFSDLFNIEVLYPFTIPLMGGGALVINELVGLGETAEITGVTAVPEPTSLLLFGSGALGVLAKVRRRKQQ